MAKNDPKKDEPPVVEATGGLVKAKCLKVQSTTGRTFHRADVGFPPKGGLILTPAKLRELGEEKVARIKGEKMLACSDVEVEVPADQAK